MTTTAPKRKFEGTLEQRKLLSARVCADRASFKNAIRIVENGGKTRQTGRYAGLNTATLKKAQMARDAGPVELDRLLVTDYPRLLPDLPSVYSDDDDDEPEEDVPAKKLGRPLSTAKTQGRSRKEARTGLQTAIERAKNGKVGRSGSKYEKLTSENVGEAIAAMETPGTDAVDAYIAKNFPDQLVESVAPETKAAATAAGSGSPPKVARDIPGRKPTSVVINGLAPPAAAAAAAVPSLASLPALAKSVVYASSNAPASMLDSAPNSPVAVSVPLPKPLVFTSEMAFAAPSPIVPVDVFQPSASAMAPTSPLRVTVPASAVAAPSVVTAAAVATTEAPTKKAGLESADHTLTDGSTAKILPACATCRAEQTPRVDAVCTGCDKKVNICHMNPEDRGCWKCKKCRLLAAVAITASNESDVRMAPRFPVVERALAAVAAVPPKVISTKVTEPYQYTSKDGHVIAVKPRCHACLVSNTSRVDVTCVACKSIISMCHVDPSNIGNWTCKKCRAKATADAKAAKAAAKSKPKSSAAAAAAAAAPKKPAVSAATAAAAAAPKQPSTASAQKIIVVGTGPVAAAAVASAEPRKIVVVGTGIHECDGCKGANNLRIALACVKCNQPDSVCHMPPCEWYCKKCRSDPSFAGARSIKPSAAADAPVAERPWKRICVREDELKAKHAALNAKCDEMAARIAGFEASWEEKAKQAEAKLAEKTKLAEEARLAAEEARLEQMEYEIQQSQTRLDAMAQASASMDDRPVVVAAVARHARATAEVAEADKFIAEMRQVQKEAEAQSRRVAAFAK